MKIRKSNIELLRIIAMLFIIGLHFWGFNEAGAFFSKSNSINENIHIVTESFMICGVDLFVLISGWFLTSNYKIKIRKIINLILEVAIWALIGFLLSMIFFNKNFDLKELIKIMFPVITGGRWFVKAYIIYILFLPFINIMLNRMNKKSHQLLLLIMLFLFCIWPSFIPIPPVLDDYGYGFTHFIFLYILISYIKKYVRNYPKKFICLVGYILSSIMVVISYKLGIGLAWGYNYFFVVLAALSLFLLFVQFDFYNKTVNLVASCAFGVFLIHTDGFFSQLIYGSVFHAVESLTYTPIKLVIIFLICLPTFYLFATVIELIRKKVCGITLDKILDCIPFINRVIDIDEK